MKNNKKRKPWNWFKKLEEAIVEQKKIQENKNSRDWWDVPNHKSLENRANSWPTCACGQLCKVLPKIKDLKNNARLLMVNDAESPADTKARNLGYKFTDHILCANYKAALKTMYKIEARTTELLKAQKSKNNQ